MQADGEPAWLLAWQDQQSRPACKRPVAEKRDGFNKKNMMWKRTAPLVAIAMLGAGCEPSPQKVAGPFYLDTTPDSREVALYRCPNGPDQGCAIDDLPVLNVIAAGGDKDFIAIHSTSGFYYFRRVDSERSGWGIKPEIVVGPMSESEFNVASRKLNLPALSIRP